MITVQANLHKHLEEWYVGKTDNPSLIVMHPDTLKELVAELMPDKKHLEIAEYGPDLTYRTVKVIRSKDVLPNEFIIK